MRVAGLRFFGRGYTLKGIHIERNRFMFEKFTDKARKVISLAQDDYRYIKKI